LARSKERTDTQERTGAGAVTFSNRDKQGVGSAVRKKRF